ncbi:restriction endonuclease subunit S [Vibrio alginolyticus]|uniref:restriction endonuclease subunit S n=1 Tax=Vibrio alginolyticus TaxID=663 RepID=UPI00215C3053|nr:restriction endonuclease subunit S [Vibrio alginolyticus]MCR9586701.1 restriction endonuclease subunit S [Vibrio alginolyticus]
MGNFNFRKCKIPTTWRLGTLGEISTSFSNQRVPLKSADRKLRQGQYRYFGAQGVIDHIDDYIFDGKYLLVAEDGENVKSRKYDIAFVVEGKFWVNNHAHVLQGNAFGDTDYLRYVLNFVSIKEYVTGQAQPKLNKAQLEKIVITIPPLDEQQKIAEILSTVDKKIDLIDKKIAETEKLKTGLLQKLFSEGVGVQDENGEWQPHTEFQTSPFGNVPKCWLKVSLENIASVERGKFSARPRNDPKYFGGNIPFVQTGDVVNAQLYVESYSQTLNELGLTVSKIFPTETILITIAANIGDVAITQFPLACPDSLVGIQAKKDICDSLWLFFFMQTQKSELDSKATKSAQKNINLQVLKPLTVFLPPLEEQEFIAEILLASEKKIALLKQQKAETQQLKKGLMQKLLTGEWRVPAEETEAA